MDFESLFNKDNLLQHFNMQLQHADKGRVVVTMPVSSKILQPFGYVHGGAIVSACETAASVGSALLINLEKQIAFGLEININYLASIQTGEIKVVAETLHIGTSTHVWDIKVYNQQRLCAVSRCTIAIKNLV